MGVVAGIGQVIGTVVAGGAAGAVGPGQQAALGAVGAFHHAVAGGECLIGQVCLHLLHIGLPRRDTGAGLGLILAQGVGHIVRRIVAPPDSGNVVGRAAHEPQILFVAGGTGLTKGLHAVGVGVAAAGGAHIGVEHVLEQTVHNIGCLRGQGLIAGGVVFQVDVAVPVQHTGVQVRGGVLAVIEDLEGSGQRRGGHAVGLAAHDHLGKAHVVGGVQGGQLQGVVDKVEDVACAHQVAHPDGDGVQGAGQTVPQGQVAAVAIIAAVVAGPAAPCVGVGLELTVGKAHQAVFAAVVLIPDDHVLLLVQGRVVEHGGPVHQPVLHAQRVRTDGLDGGAGLPGHTVSTVQGKALGLFAQTAHHGQHIAVIVQRDHGRLGADIAVVVYGAVIAGAGLGGAVGVHHLHVIVRDAGHLFLMPAGREVSVALVEHQVLHGRLHLGVDGGLDGIAAGVEHGLGRGFVHALLVHDVVDHLGEEGIGEVAGHGGGLLVGVLLGQHKGLGRAVAVILLRDDALLPHIIHDEVAAVDQVLGVGVGVVVGGVLGDGRDGSALPEGELAHVLVEILVGRCLNALNGAGEADGVQVGLQNGLLGVGAAQAEGAVDLAQLAQRTLHAAGALVAGQVLDELLLQRGSALLGAVNGQQILVDHGTDGALEVHARLVVEILVLGADERILQVGGDLFQVCPDAVAVGGAQGGILHLRAGVGIGGHHSAGLAQLDVVQVQQVAVVGRGLHGVVHRRHCRQAAHHDAQADEGSQRAAQRPEDGVLRLFPGLLWLPGGTPALGRLFPAAVAHIHFTSPRGPHVRACSAAVDLSRFV